MRILILVLITNLSIHAQPFKIKLWENNQPNFINVNEEEIVEYDDQITKISHVQNPEIEVFLPSQSIATGQAVVIFPGGGYWILAYDKEGTDVAKYFNSKGIAAIVLKYRLPVSKCNIVPHLSPLLDAKRAIRLVRYHAQEWNIIPNQIGVMGFSAGGHLASTLSTHYDKGDKTTSLDSIEYQSCRPDFAILVYPVISFNNTYGHAGSKYALLGKDPDKSLINYYSNELHVTNETPPTILIHASDDKGVSVINSLAYYKSLKANQIISELHVYSEGGHGFGLATKNERLSEWPEQCIKFIKFLFKD